MNQIRIMIVEDDGDYQYLIAQAIEKESDFLLVAQCLSAAEACQSAKLHRPDIVLMDLNLTAQQMDGMEAARRIRIETDAKVIILTSFDQPELVIQASTRSFASGYVFKSQFSLLVPTIRATASGMTPQAFLICSAILKSLTPAEYSVFEYLLGQKVSLRSSNKTIANQQTSVLHKLGLSGKQELRHVFAAYFPGLSAPAE